MHRHVSCFVIVLAVVVAAAADTVRDHQIEPEDYFSLVSISEIAVAPDGGLVAYTEVRWGADDERRTTDLWVVDPDTRKRQRLTFDRVGARSVRWSADGAFVYFLGRFTRPGADTPPYDGSTQVWRVRPAGGEAFAVTRVKDGIGHFDLAGDVLFYTTSHEVVADEWKELQEQFSDLEYGRGVHDYSQLWSLDLESWRERELASEHRVVHDLSASPDGRRVAMITSPEQALVTHEGWSTVDVYDVAGGAVTTLTKPPWREHHPSPYGWLGDLAWSHDSAAVAFTVSFDGYPSELLVSELTGAETGPRQLERPDGVHVGGALRWHPSRRELLFVGVEQARRRLYGITAVDAGGQGAALTLTPGDVVVGAFSMSADGSDLFATINTTTHPRDIFRVGADGSMDRITLVNPQVDSWQLPSISIVTWTGGDGDQVAGILELPPGHETDDGPLPLVVELHGGPSSATDYAMRFWIYGRTLLAARGYALLSPNYHGSTGYGDDFMTGLIGRENNIEIRDILTGVDAMVERGIADPQRLAVMGWSNGGLLTNAVITHTNRFKAASSGAGVVDMVLQWAVEDTPGHVVNFMRGLPWQTPDAYHEASAIYALDRVTTPTLIHVGGDDPRVPPAHSRALFRAFHRYLGVPTQLVVYPGEGHSPTVRKNRLAKMKWDLAWFDKYLTGSSE